MKKCNKCFKEKELNYFHKDKSKKDGLRPTCKECIKDYSKNYLIDNIETIKKNKRQFYLDNKENILNKNKSYAKSNPNILKKANDKYINNNKEKVIKTKLKWKENNKDKIKQSGKQYYLYLKKHKPYIFAWRGTIKNYLSRLEIKKSDKTKNLLGYSALVLKTHLENLFTDGMTWDNYGEWHVDHIKPVSSFTSDTLPSVVNALNNLQPLWATTREINGVIYEGNLNKGNKQNG